MPLIQSLLCSAVAVTAVGFVDASFIRERASALAQAHAALGDVEQNRDTSTALRRLDDGRTADTVDAEAQPTALLETGAAAEAEAQWRFSTNYVPQHYGNWKFEKGAWNFGADDRIQCESCGYCLYFAVDQLGDTFDAEKVNRVLTDMVGQVQWVFRSACEHIIKKSKKQIVANMMKLVEPQETCRAAGYCSADPFDVMVQKGGRTIKGGTGASSGFAPTMTINPVDPPSRGVMGSGTDMITVQHPGRGFQTKDGGFQMYPSPGSRPISTTNPMSPYNFGGYDAYGFPEAAPGVPSATPTPPATNNAGLGLMASTLSDPQMLSTLIPGLASVNPMSAMSPHMMGGMGGMPGAMGGAMGGMGAMGGGMGGMGGGMGGMGGGMGGMGGGMGGMGMGGV